MFTLQAGLLNAARAAVFGAAGRSLMQQALPIVMLAAVWLAAAPARAATLDIEFGGTNGGNVLWDVILTPDPSPAAAVEIGFAYDGGQILAVTPNAAAFSFSNPGQNPFTGTVTVGVSIHDVLGTADGAFAALGAILSSYDPVRVLTIETNGAGTLNFGGQDHNGLFTGARVAQGGVNYDGLTGSLSVDYQAADFNRDSAVDGTDLAIWSGSYGGPATGASGDATGDGLAGGGDFLVWQQQFNGGAANAVSTGAVPEPTAAVLLMLAGVSGLTMLRRRRA